MEVANNNKVEAGCISLGPWGSKKEGEPWSYFPNGHFTQIIIRHGDCINSVSFQSINHETGLAEYSKKIGGSDGEKTVKVCIDTREEQLESIDMTVGELWCQTVVRSITFNSSFATYGPIGSPLGHNVSNPLEGGVIVGFHGRAGTYLNSLGFYVVPTRSHFAKMLEGYATGGRVGLIKSALPRDIGPWGSSGGKRWDDGVFSRVQQARIYVSDESNELQGIQFEYEKADGGLIWSALHGSNDNSSAIPISLQWEEFLGIEGYVGNFTNDKSGSDGIRSITLYTDKGKYGPFGVENGKHFMSSITGGKIVGFWGGSGTYLNAIGVHMSYF